MSTIVNPRQALRIACIALLLAVPALAASDRNVAAQSKSDAPKAKHAKAALDGYCPVCITKIKKWVRGDPQHQAAHNGKTYWFPGEKQKRMFLADPAKYIPALDGDCTVCFAKKGKRVPGRIRHAAFYDKRLFLFPGDAQKKEFLANPTAYANVGRVTAEGQSGCAACDHGVVPLGAPNVLGLAVSANDGNIYVVEDAHKLYPDVYRRRFEQLRLAVTGEELQRRGKIVWIQPSHLEVLN